METVRKVLNGKNQLTIIPFLKEYVHLEAVQRNIWQRCKIWKDSAAELQKASVQNCKSRLKITFFAFRAIQKRSNCMKCVRTSCSCVNDKPNWDKTTKLQLPFITYSPNSMQKSQIFMISWTQISSNVSLDLPTLMCVCEV